MYSGSGAHRGGRSEFGRPLPPYSPPHLWSTAVERHELAGLNLFQARPRVPSRVPSIPLSPPATTPSPSQASPALDDPWAGHRLRPYGSSVALDGGRGKVWSPPPGAVAALGLHPRRATLCCDTRSPPPRGSIAPTITWLATGEARGAVALLMYKPDALMSPRVLLPADVWGGGGGHGH